MLDRVASTEQIAISQLKVVTATYIDLATDIQVQPFSREYLHGSLELYLLKFREEYCSILKF